MSTKMDPRPVDRGMSAGRAIAENDNPNQGEENELELSDEKLLMLVGQAEDSSRDSLAQRMGSALERSQRAWRNEHAAESKYNDRINYRGRSRLFVPKTRMAMRKNKAGAAAALFATNDVISISAFYDDDEQQLASAGVVKQIVDYRLSAQAGAKSGIPWFIIAVAARHDADVQGCCISKQYWEYREVDTGETETVRVQTGTDAEGYATWEEVERPVLKVVRDRPMIELLPIENCYADDAAPWFDPIQGGAYFIAKWPMHLSDLKAAMKGEGKHGSGPAWKEVGDDVLRQGFEDNQRAGTRRAREKGADRFDRNKTPKDFDIIWVNENFIRYNGREITFWSIGRHALLSEPAELEEVYPAHRGARPYVAGVAEVEPHVASPIPPVETWQPLQLEINDVTNLRLDTLKRSIAPFAKVRRGRKVDYDALKRRGTPEGMVILDDLDDVVFEKTPGPGGESYTETAHANAFFDELSGTFGGSTVQTNRQIGETVGGMQMMGSAANAVSEYDLRVWVETWVEPVLRQIIHLVQYYENDENILTLAGRKAKSFQRYGVNPTLDNLLESDVTLQVNVGIGSQDPMQQLAKFKMAFEMLIPMAGEIRSQGITIDAETIIEEIFGRAGFKEGRRFFKFGQQMPEQPNPEMEKIKAQMAMKDKELMQRDNQAQLEAQTKLQVEEMDNQTEFMTEAMKARLDHSARMAEGEADYRTRLAEVFRPQESPQRPAKKTAQSGGGSNVPATQQDGSGAQSAVLMALVDRLEEMGGQNQQMPQMMAQMMGAFVQAVDRLEEVANGMSAPRRVVRDPQTNEIIGVVPATGNMAQAG